MKFIKVALQKISQETFCECCTVGTIKLARQDSRKIHLFLQSILLSTNNNRPPEYIGN